MRLATSIVQSNVSRGPQEKRPEESRGFVSARKVFREIDQNFLGESFSPLSVGNRDYVACRLYSRDRRKFPNASEIRTCEETCPSSKYNARSLNYLTSMNKLR